jgi:hypothetical protein
VGLQVADAHIKADGLARLLGGEPDVSNHPSSEHRQEPDDMLGLIASLFAPRGAGVSPWTEADFTAAADMQARPWVLATAGSTGLTAEFPFISDVPAAIAGCTETALLTASSTERHPQLGSGLLLRLQLPINFPKDCGAEAAVTLNLLEAAKRTDAHTLGAWCLGPDLGDRGDQHSVNFVSFVPAAAYRRGLLEVLALDMGIRARRLADLSFRDSGARTSTPEQIAEVLRTASSPENLDLSRKAYRAGSAAVAAESAELAKAASKTRELWHTRSHHEVECGEGSEGSGGGQSSPDSASPQTTDLDVMKDGARHPIVTLFATISGRLWGTVDRIQQFSLATFRKMKGKNPLVALAVFVVCLAAGATAFLLAVMLQILLMALFMVFAPLQLFAAAARRALIRKRT